MSYCTDCKWFAVESNPLDPAYGHLRCTNYEDGECPAVDDQPVSGQEYTRTKGGEDDNGQGSTAKWGIVEISVRIQPAPHNVDKGDLRD